jgi:nitroreductase
MSGEPISDEELMQLLEAARWAPSCYNEQPWRICYARKHSPHFASFLDLLVEFNRGWAHRAAVLGIFVSHKVFARNQKPSPTHAFDTGAAWENLALQGTAMNLVVHGMGGFDYARAKTLIRAPDNYEVLAMFAIGKPAPAETLSPELQKRESPSERMPVSQFAVEGALREV